MRWLIVLLIIYSAVFACSAYAANDIYRQGSIPLLALVANGSDQFGTVATLDLELRPGRERVFLETFPMTKITTQASLRFAQQVACNELDIDCSQYDFLFTIHALPGIVGGPSAGSAAATLTAALLLNKPIPEDIALTGTINSGGLIGAVGGVSQKVEAAAFSGIKIVFVPQGSKAMEYGNKSISISEYSKDLNMTVKEVSTFSEILEAEFGVPQKKIDQPLLIDEHYLSIMEQVADDLCSRTGNSSDNLTQNKIANFTDRSSQARKNGEFYAAASYCFRANVEQKTKEYQQKNFTVEEFRSKLALLKDDAHQFKTETENHNVSTLTDLQTYMVVMERIEESISLIDSIKADLSTGKTSPEQLALAEERLFSAKTWSRFFNGRTSTLVINNERLKQGCAAKISEAEERYNYVKSVLPTALDGTKADIDKSYELLRDKKYIMCLHTAAKAKAEADLILGLLGVEESMVDNMLELKLKIARQALAKAQERDTFPIIAYSYYEYANSLKDFDKAPSLLFAEYALELANLEIYFKENSAFSSGPKLVTVAQKNNTATLAIGIILLAVFLAFVFMLINQSQESRKTLQAPPKQRLRGKKR